MATPAMLQQSFNTTIQKGNAGSIRINTFTPAGVALDVSSGYTLAVLKAQPAGNANTDGAAVDISGDVTPAFDATGVTLSFTAAQANTMIGALAALFSTVYARLSNDAGTTSSIAAVGQLSVDANSELS